MGQGDNAHTRYLGIYHMMLSVSGIGRPMGDAAGFEICSPAF